MEICLRLEYRHLFTLGTETICLQKCRRSMREYAEFENRRFFFIRESGLTQT